MGINDIAGLAWIDLETTGTDETKDLIIELALIVTRPDLTPVPIAPNGYYSSVVRFDTEGVKQAAIERIKNNPVVHAMHTANGLLESIEADEGKPAGLIDQEVRTILKGIGHKRKAFMIAGSGVGHFDRRFIKRQMPQIEAMLDHPAFDIGVFRRMAQAWGVDMPDFQTIKTHRALDDLRAHLQEAAWDRAFMRLAPAGA